ncbi:hypothetical protein [Allobranchiibius sp. GilTou73]|uniref:hypothetical protein n=1 Tax=Allobranchiibius sp. GilTou73 TaxID=2904523 RepID=UPI001F1B7D66|nr:hypothetical protein [Allobranchiibius sp. GilTou73]UIJ33548.1 hypothetical protein LVQ62_10210 [Allobranchiibius sp. GilTou73]
MLFTAAFFVVLVFGDDFLAVFFVVFAAPAVARAAGVAASRDATLPAAGRAVLRAVADVLAADPVRAAFFAGVFFAGAGQRSPSPMPSSPMPCRSSSS